jgi:hypothetical protein
MTTENWLILLGVVMSVFVAVCGFTMGLFLAVTGWLTQRSVAAIDAAQTELKSDIKQQGHVIASVKTDIAVIKTTTDNQIEKQEEMCERMEMVETHIQQCATRMAACHACPIKPT